MSFTDAVLSIPEIAECLRNGLQALERQDKNRIKVNSPRDLKGSVYIDKCLEKLYPNEPRWDYVLGYREGIYYVEVHPADNTRKVREIIAKLEWLKRWLRLSAKNLEDLTVKRTYHWISTGKTASSLKRGKYRQILAKKGIRGPVSILNADSIS